ncbi:MAG: LptF/LptG family permease, partial [Lentisphaerae bacterium]|nr:LptF/LptG family permease [Lentisphaerota bacterium]
METPLSFLDEGRFIRDLPGYTIYIGRKQDQTVHDVVIYEFGETGPRQTVRADSGEIISDPANPHQIKINLRHVRIEQADEDDPGNLQLTRRVSADEYPVIFDMSDLIRSGIIWKKRADLTMREIADAVREDYFLRPGDIRDLPELLRALRRPPLAGAVSRIFAPATRLLLDATARGTIAPITLKQRLAEELNALIDGPVIYDPEIFAGVELDQYVQPLLDQEPDGNARRRLNRMLLEHLFPLQLENHYLSHVGENEMQSARMALILEASTRMALSFSCFAFTLLGVGLGIRIHRRESYLGMAMALVLVFVFYFFIILADALVS